ncbi:MAG: hypothetical protein H6Q77_1104 [Gemmatimonadetes bacterium]|nr:hypothetical protein [Gemmatimonadota bacterium]
MGKMMRLAAVLFAFVAFAPRAEAQAPAAKPKASPLKAAANEYSFEIRPTIGLVIPLAPSGDVGWDLGGSFRVKPPTWPVGLQLDLIWIDLTSSTFQFTLDGVYQFATSSSSFNPYAIAGLGMYDGDFGLNAGLGADFAISGSPIGFFAETRFHVVFVAGDNPNLLPINAGVRIRF